MVRSRLIGSSAPTRFGARRATAFRKTILEGLDGHAVSIGQALVGVNFPVDAANATATRGALAGRRSSALTVGLEGKALETYQLAETLVGEVVLGADGGVVAGALFVAVDLNALARVGNGDVVAGGVAGTDVVVSVDAADGGGGAWTAASVGRGHAGHATAVEGNADIEALGDAGIGVVLVVNAADNGDVGRAHATGVVCLIAGAVVNRRGYGRAIGAVVNRGRDGCAIGAVVSAVGDRRGDGCAIGAVGVVGGNDAGKTPAFVNNSDIQTICHAGTGV